MSVSITNAFNDGDYKKIAQATKNGIAVRILKEKQLDEPLKSISPTYVTAKGGDQYALESNLIFKSLKDACEVQNISKDVLAKRYQITGNDFFFNIYSGTKQYNIERQYNDRSNVLALNSESNLIDKEALQDDIPVFLYILETMINAGYSYYKIQINRKFSTELMVCANQRMLKDEKTQMKEPDIKALEYISPEELSVSFDDIGGCEEAKDALLLIAQGLENPQILNEWGARQPTGIMFYGPSGTGKTLLAKAVANEINANFYRVISSEVTSHWYGDSEKIAKQLFDTARKNTPAILFVDEMDTIATNRDDLYEPSRRVLNAILQEMDGLKKLEGVIVLGATNRICDIDPAVLRPGRFDQIIEVPMPDENARKRIYELKIQGRKIAPKNLSMDIDYEELSKSSDGLSGADIDGIVEDCISGKRIQIMKGTTPAPICTEDLLSAVQEYRTNQDRIRGAMPADVKARLYA